MKITFEQTNGFYHGAQHFFCECEWWIMTVIDAQNKVYKREGTSKESVLKIFQNEIKCYNNSCPKPEYDDLLEFITNTIATL